MAAHRNAIAAGLSAVLATLVAPAAEAQTLRGSRTAMQTQNRVAHDHDYTFLRDAAHVRRFVDLGLLVELRGNANYELASVAFPVARPAVKLFVERLSAQYRSACGEKLVVTSLTRPLSQQPRNASDLSVHPAGMAVDLRISSNARCRAWLERTLLSLEGAGVINAIRERFPPHYHVAVYPRQYLAYVDRISGGRGPRLAAADGPARVVATNPGRAGARSAEVAATDPPPPAAAVADAPGPDAGFDGETVETARHRVARGETLWSIARRHGTTIGELQQLNGLRDTRINAGQVLTVPVAAAQ
jgi:hypothetical protein